MSRKYSNKYYQLVAKELGIGKLDNEDELALIEDELRRLGIGNLDSMNDVSKFYSDNGYTGPPSSSDTAAGQLKSQAEAQFAENEAAAAAAQESQQDYINSQQYQSLLALQQNNSLLERQVNLQEKQFQANLEAAAAAEAEAKRQFDLQFKAQQEAAAEASRRAAEQARRASNIANAFIPAPEKTAYSAAVGDYREELEESRDSSLLSNLVLQTGVDMAGVSSQRQDVSLSGLLLA